MSSTNIDYANTYFQYPVLTKIHGEPTFESIRTLHNEIKANALSVVSTLGGGAHGHLGLVLSLADYARITIVPYLRPAHPGILTIAAGTANYEAERLTKEHREAIREWRETEDVEKTIIKQIVAAIDAKYLKALRNRLTNSITSSVAQVIRYLKDRYGIVPPDILAEAERDVRNLHYDLREPISMIFDDIEDLELLGIEAKIAYTPQQLINFATDILIKNSAFEQTLIAWNSKPIADKTWDNLKAHFEAAHLSLRLVRGRTMQDSGFHQANNMANKVLQEIQEVQANVLQALDENRDIQVQQQANAINSDSGTHLGIMELLKSLQDEVKAMKAERAEEKRKNKERYEQRQKTGKYCWSCGGCNHFGKDCTKKKPGHKDEAKFNNIMEGCTTNVKTKK